MDPVQFFASSKLLIVAGKGGVGKTVVAATVAAASARLGLSSLLVEVGGRSNAGPLLGVDDIGYEPREVRLPDDRSGRLEVRSITPDDALVEWLSLHGFRRLIDRMARSGLLEVVATATPGIKDLLVLGKLKNLVATGAADLIVVDAAAAGHALGFLRAPVTIRETARAGTIHRQAVEAHEMLADPDRCRVMLVTIAEETPVNELTETAFALEDEIGVRLAPIVVNSVLVDPGRPPGGDVEAELVGDIEAELGGVPPEVAGDLLTATRFRTGRLAVQRTQLARLTEQVPLEQIHLPHLFEPTLGPEQVSGLATRLISSIRDLREPRA